MSCIFSEPIPYSTQMDASNYLRCDDLAALADAGDIWADETPAPSAPAMPTQAQTNGWLEQARINDPAGYLMLGSMVRAFMKGVSQTAPYQAVPGARDALESTLHATGVR